MDQQPSSTPSQTPPQPAGAPGGNNVIYSSNPNGVVRPGGAGKPSRARLFAIGGAAAVVVLGTAAYVFGFYIPNKPENVFNSALTNTGKGYDELVAYMSDKELEEKFKTSEFSGTIDIDSPDFSTDGSFKGKMDDKNNATFSGDLGLGTTRLEVEGVSRAAENATSPDIYLKLGGIKGLGANFGMPDLDTLDNQWITIDRSLIDTLANQAEAAGGLQASDATNTPKQEDVTDAAKAVGEVSKKYLFTTDESTAVFTMKEYVGKETVDGKNTNHYKVAVDKKNLKAFAKELGEKLDKSKLNDWAKETYNKNLSELIDTKGMQEDADNIKDGDTFDVWVNSDTKLIHKMRFNDPENKGSYMDIGLNWDGGDEKPFFINYKGTVDGEEMNVKLQLALNTKTDVVKAEMSVDGTSEGNEMAVVIKAEIKPATGSVNADVPEGAITLSDALSRIGLGGYLELMTQTLEEQAALQPGVNIYEPGTEPTDEELYGDPFAIEQ